MIVFGTCKGYPEKFTRYAVPGVQRAMGDEPYRYLAMPSNGRDIFPVYAEIMREAAKQEDLEALVLLHDDLELLDVDFAKKVRLVVPELAVVGAVGAVGVRSLCWWDGRKVGRARDAAFGLHNYGFPGSDWLAKADSVDGMLLILSPWAVRNLTLIGLGYESLHGYAEELCFQARSKGQLVAVTDIELMHHSKGGIAGDSEGWKRACAVFQERWSGTWS